MFHKLSIPATAKKWRADWYHTLFSISHH